MNRFDYAARLREPSTWSGFAALLAFFGPHYADPGLQQTVVTGGVLLGGVLSMFIGEKSK